jgi:hypothetical protein
MRSLPFAAASMPVASSPEPASSWSRPERRGAEAEVARRGGELRRARRRLGDAGLEVAGTARDPRQAGDEPVQAARDLLHRHGVGLELRRVAVDVRLQRPQRGEGALHIGPRALHGGIGGGRGPDAAEVAQRRLDRRLRRVHRIDELGLGLVVLFVDDARELVDRILQLLHALACAA